MLLFRRLAARAMRRIANAIAPHPVTFQFTKEDEGYSSYDIGDWTYGHPIVRSYGDGAVLKIGKYCSIASDVVILLVSEHRTDWVSTYPFRQIFTEAADFPGGPASRGDVIIGNDVWIGYQAMILSGVTIGNGAVIGARGVVRRNVPSYSIVAGNPARHIRFRFDHSVIDRLQALAWWDWPRDKVVEALPFLLSNDVIGLLRKYETAG